MLDLYKIAQTHRDFESRLRIVRQFRTVQNELLELPGSTDKGVQQCYGELARLLDREILPFSQLGVEEGQRLSVALEAGERENDKDSEGINWSVTAQLFHLLAGYGRVAGLHHYRMLYRDVGPPIRKLVAGLETLDANLHLLSRYTHWILDHYSTVSDSA